VLEQPPTSAAAPITPPINKGKIRTETPENDSTEFDNDARRRGAVKPQVYLPV
jgi:hypothetical protein